MCCHRLFPFWDVGLCTYSLSQPGVTLFIGDKYEGTFEGPFGKNLLKPLIFLDYLRTKVRTFSNHFLYLRIHSR